MSLHAMNPAELAQSRLVINAIDFETEAFGQGMCSIRKSGVQAIAWTSGTNSRSSPCC